MARVLYKLYNLFISYFNESQISVVICILLKFWEMYTFTTFIYMKISLAGIEKFIEYVLFKI